MLSFFWCYVGYEYLQWPLHKRRKIETERRILFFVYPLRYFELLDTNSAVQEINLRGLVRLYS